MGNVLNLKYCRPSLFGDVAMAPPIEVFQLTRDFQVVFYFCLKLLQQFARLPWFGPYLEAFGYFHTMNGFRKEI
jgi:hypothetical protein